MTHLVRPKQAGKTYEYAWVVPAARPHRLTIRSYLALAHNKTVVMLDDALILELMDADTAGRLRLPLDGQAFELRWIISSRWADDSFVLLEGDKIVASSGHAEGIRRLSGTDFHIEDVKPKGCGLLAALVAAALTALVTIGIAWRGGAGT
jgi:hypothetical protein